MSFLKLVIGIVFFCFYVQSVFSQKISAEQNNQVNQALQHNFEEVDFNLVSANTDNCFVTLKDTFYNPNGYHFLYKLKGDSLIRCDHSIFHGGNFKRYLFTHEQNIYLLGGYGLFNTNNNLEVFNWNLGEWSCIKTTGSKPPFVHGISFRKDSCIYTMSNMKSGNGVEPNVYDNSIYKLDLKTMIWSKFRNINSLIKINEVTDESLMNVYFDDYIVSLRPPDVIIFKLSTLQYLVTKTEFVPFPISTNKQYSIKHNSIIFNKSSSSGHLKFLHQTNLDSIFDSNIHLAEALILEPEWYQFEAYNPFVILIMIGLVACCFIIIYFQKIKDNFYISKLPIADSIIIEKLKAHPEKIISITDLDIIFGIQYMEIDNKRQKRHRIIRRIDNTKPGMLVRLKDDTDKRRNTYKLNGSA